MIYRDRGTIGFVVELDGISDPADLKKQKDDVVQQIADWVSWSTQDVEPFNCALRRTIREDVRNRKNELLRLRGLVGALEIPMRRLDDVKPLFTAPLVRKQVSPLRLAEEGPHEDEYTMSDAVYADILQTISEFGKVFERYPATFSGMEEADFRNVLLWGLTPLYGITGSVTGETFNMGGKSDILIRYRNQNLFVAECKIWDGPQVYLDTIDQLLGYLSWRDSKSAIIMFVRSGSLSHFVDEIRKATPSHGLFVSELTKRSDAWLNYAFRMRQDSAREMKVAVMLFNVPKKKNPE
jgi:hypothetical protein